MCASLCLWVCERERGSLWFLVAKVKAGEEIFLSLHQPWKKRKDIFSLDRALLSDWLKLSKSERSHWSTAEKGCFISVLGCMTACTTKEPSRINTISQLFVLSYEQASRCQFHQYSTSSSFMRRSQKRKKSLTTWLSFCRFRDLHL